MNVRKRRIVAIVQARLGSTRLPNKVMRPIAGRPAIEILLKRLAKSSYIDVIVVATTTNHRDDDLETFVDALGFACFRGDETNVLKRYADAADVYDADIVVRITGDCPLVDPNVVDSCLELFLASEVDYASNVMPPTYPDGLDVEVFTTTTLRRAVELASDPFDLEHVTPFIRRNEGFKTVNLSAQSNFEHFRLTLDYEEDLKILNAIFKELSGQFFFGWESAVQVLYKLDRVNQLNEGYARWEGSKMSLGQKVWSRAKQIIPNGNMLLSKRPDMFLPNSWPAYYEKAEGCEVWDLEGRKFFDFANMSVGTCTLGYGHPEVDEAVIKSVRDGNMSTLNCREEVDLIETLVQLHPGMAWGRLARSGGEINAVATRIGRAHSGRSGVAVCGYHGWHDWYLAANIGDSSALDQHLMSGLASKGVPTELLGTIFTFEYNNIESLKRLLQEQKNIGVIKMEVSRTHQPRDGFLEEVRSIADEYGMVLIFDECTSGFREALGGICLNYGVVPDMLVFGKALGNGYAITALLGVKKLFEAASSTFMSSTFWSERIGPTAALATLNVMKRDETWKTIPERGRLIKKTWKTMADDCGLNIEITGIDALPNFKIISSNWLKLKTFITQEMLKKDFLATNTVYVSMAHTDDLISEYFEAMETTFKVIADYGATGEIDDLLDGPVCSAGFTKAR